MQRDHGQVFKSVLSSLDLLYMTGLVGRIKHCNLAVTLFRRSGRGSSVGHKDNLCYPVRCNTGKSHLACARCLLAPAATAAAKSAEATAAIAAWAAAAVAASVETRPLTN